MFSDENTIFDAIDTASKKMECFIHNEKFQKTTPCDELYKVAQFLELACIKYELRAIRKALNSTHSDSLHEIPFEK